MPSLVKLAAWMRISSPEKLCATVVGEVATGVGGEHASGQWVPLATAARGAATHPLTTRVLFGNCRWRSRCGVAAGADGRRCW